jgi:hypothetical protein
MIKQDASFLFNHFSILLNKKSSENPILPKNSVLSMYGHKKNIPAWNVFV